MQLNWHGISKGYTRTKVKKKLLHLKENTFNKQKYCHKLSLKAPSAIIEQRCSLNKGQTSHNKTLENRHMALALREALSFIFLLSVKKNTSSYFYWSVGKICEQVKILNFHFYHLNFFLPFLLNEPETLRLLVIT